MHAGTINEIQKWGLEKLRGDLSVLPQKNIPRQKRRRGAFRGWGGAPPPAQLVKDCQE